MPISAKDIVWDDDKATGTPAAAAPAGPSGIRWDDEAASGPPAPAAPTSDTPWYKVASHGLGQGAFVDPALGATQLALHSGRVGNKGEGGGILSALNTFNPMAAASTLSDIADMAAQGMGYKAPNLYDRALKGVDQYTTKESADYEKWRQEHGDTGFDWWRLGGNIASPVNWIGPEGEALTAARFASPLAKAAAGVARSSAQGGLLSMLQPVTAQPPPQSINDIIAGRPPTPVSPDQLQLSDSDYWSQKGLQGAFGALGGSALHGAGLGVGLTGKTLADVWRTTAPGGERNIIGNVLKDILGGSEFQQPPLPGMQPTTAQVTNNDAALQLERALGARPDVDMGISDTRAINNAAIRNAYGDLGGNLKADRTTAMHGAITAAEQDADKGVEDAWSNAGINKATGVMSTPMKDAVGQWYDGLTIADRSEVPSTLFEPMSKLPDVTTLGELQGFRAKIRQAVSSAYSGSNPNANLGRILMGAKQAVDNAVDNPQLDMTAANSPIFTDPDFMAKYQAARDATQQYHETYTRADAVRKALGDKTEPAQVAGMFIKPNRPALLQSYLKAAGPDGAQAVRDTFSQMFLNASENTARDTQGNYEVSYPAITNFLDQYQHVIDQPGLFTDAQKAVFGKIQDAADMVARSNRPIQRGGSDTTSKLLGNKYIDAILSPASAEAIQAGGEAGGILSALGHHPVTGLAAYALSRIPAARIAATRGRSIQLLAQAMQDPQLAQVLMMEAKPGAESFIPSLLKNRPLNFATRALPTALGAQMGATSVQPQPAAPAPSAAPAQPPANPWAGLPELGQ